MPLFFIALIGLLLFFLFLRTLAQVSSSVLGDTLKWTSVTLLGVAFALFILSGRILFATALAALVGILVLRHMGRKPPPPQGFLPPPPS